MVSSRKSVEIRTFYHGSNLGGVEYQGDIMTQKFGCQPTHNETIHFGGTINWSQSEKLGMVYQVTYRRRNGAGSTFFPPWSPQPVGYLLKHRIVHWLIPQQFKLRRQIPSFPPCALFFMGRKNLFLWYGLGWGPPEHQSLQWRLSTPHGNWWMITKKRTVGQKNNAILQIANYHCNILQLWVSK